MRAEILKMVRQKRRISRVRKKVDGQPDRPRLAVSRSNTGIYAQIIDDVNGVTLVSASTLEKGFSGETGNAAAAEKVGKAIAEKAIKAGITEVVFDRGGFIFHGRVKALADGARAGGLKF